ncbi:MAG: DUF3021 domain-containing protein [Clostridia bacterium]|nr:DUF3021 domain-containing protein [Clostridia bacterium]
MKKFISGFLQRGLIACGFGPIILAIVYACIQANGTIDTLTVNEVVLGVLTSALLAFIAGGINAVYQIERLPLSLSVLIHGVVLYIDYIVIYLINDWMESNFIPLLVFTICFVIGFALIWAIIYFTTKKSTDKLNQRLAEHQKISKDAIED